MRESCVGVGLCFYCCIFALDLFGWLRPVDWGPSAPEALLLFDL